MKDIIKFVGIISLMLSVQSHADPLAQAIKVIEKQQPAPLIPRSVFMQKSSLNAVKLSPDGHFLSYLQKHQHHQTLWLFDIEQNQHRQLLNNKTIKDTQWASDSGFIFVENTQGVMGVSVKPNVFPRLIKKIEPQKDMYFYGIDNTQPQAFITSEKNQKTKEHQLIRVFSDGSSQVLYQHKDRVLDFVLTNSGELAFIKQRAGTGADLIDVRTSNTKRFKHCLFYDMCSMHVYQKNTNKLLVKGRFNQDLTGLFSIDLNTYEATLIHQDPQQRFDLGTVYYDSEYSPRLASYETEFIQQYALDTVTQGQLDKINPLFNQMGHTKKVLQFKPSRDFGRWLIIDMSPQKAHKNYYLYDHTTNKLSEPLTEIQNNPEPKAGQMIEANLAHKMAIDYQTSDGMSQFGYLTLPIGKKINQVPLVVVPHGGPWSRASGGYDPIVQLLANRGYAVFEPNFRASTGMGKHYVMSANKDFGDGRVQQDIIDGLEYVLAQGVGHRDKLAIFGHSFGGFSTLAALAFTPELFKVGIAGAPPTDLAQSVKMLKDQKQNDRQQQRQVLLKQLAVDSDDPDAMLRLYNQSPDAHWQNIVRPLYMMAGGQDDRVSVARVKDFAIRLNQANKPITLLVDEKEGHSPEHEVAREAYAYLLEKALATHLKTGYQVTISDNLKRYLKRNLIIDNNGLLAL
jgi:dipeptidyl aminopeptidase/acylaminoacyl peptidase